MTLDAAVRDFYSLGMSDKPSIDTFPGSRPSASAEASLAAERSRVRAMTVEERMRLALSLDRQLRRLKPQQMKG